MQAWRRVATTRPSVRALSSQADKPWRIVGAAVIQKLPEIVWDHEPWQAKYDAFTLRKANRNARNAPDWLHNMPDHDPAGVEEGRFEPGCKISEFDLVDDVTSPYRCLAENLFFVVRRDREEFEWEFPQADWVEGETLRDTVERCMPEVYGKEMKSWIFGNAPMGHYEYTHDANHPHHEQFQGTKVFCYHCAVMTPKSEVLLDESKCLDYAWATKEELVERYIEDPELVDLCGKMLGKPNYSPYTFYDEDYEELEDKA